MADIMAGIVEVVLPEEREVVTGETIHIDGSQSTGD
jgi:hypothetical protein